MATRNNSVVTLTILGMFISFTCLSAQELAAPAPEAKPQLEWSKNATEAQTAELIQQAEILIRQKQQEQAAGIQAATTKPSVDTQTTTLPVVRDGETGQRAKTLEVKPQLQYQPMNADSYTPAPAKNRSYLNTAVIYWLPGAFALLATICMLIYARTQLKKATRAGKRASMLIAEIEDLQRNIKQWELESHYSHISEMSVHIEAMQETIATAKEVGENTKETIDKGIELNQKSIEILRKANKELSKSLTSQVNELEEQLKSTVAGELQKIDQAASEKIATLEKHKSQIVQDIQKHNQENKALLASISESKTSGLNSSVEKPQTQSSMMDIITNELNAIKNKERTGSLSSFGSTSKTTEISHADMLRESIARQKASLSERPALKQSLTNTSEPQINTDAASETGSTKAQEVFNAAVELKNELSDSSSPSLNNTGNISKYADMDNKALMDKLTHAEKWRNYKLAAEICEEMTSRNGNRPEVYDIWGQMLARQASLEKGQDSATMLDQASHKMQKAASLDSTNYKIFNNWGVILKNLALTQSDSRETEKILSLARRKFETSLSLNPKNHEALNNWGNTLLIQSRFRSGTLQESLLQSACEKFAQALNLKPDKDSALYGWGNALFKLANCKSDSQVRNLLLLQAKEKWEAANRLNSGIASKELRIIRGLVPPLDQKQTHAGKPVTDYKFKTVNR